MIETTLGPMDEDTLVKTEGVLDNDNEHTTWVEYRLTPDGDVIHRSAHIHLKHGLLLESVAGGF